MGAVKRAGMNWSKEELEYIEENADRQSTKVIARRLNRSEDAVRIKCSRLGLGMYKYNTDELSNYALANMLDIDWKTIRIWHDKGLKFKRVGNQYMHTHENVIRFLRDHQELWDSTRGDMHLVNQKKWYKAKHEADLSRKNKRTKWTALDKNRLLMYQKQGRRWKDIALMLGRTERSCLVKYSRIMKEECE